MKSLIINYLSILFMCTGFLCLCTRCKKDSRTDIPDHS